MRESFIERYVVELVKEMGGEIRKVQWVGRNGAPDRVIMLPNKLIWMELKAPGEKAKPHQQREHDRMRKMGQHVEVVDSIERVEEVLQWQS